MLVTASELELAAGGAACPPETLQAVLRMCSALRPLPTPERLTTVGRGRGRDSRVGGIGSRMADGGAGEQMYLGVLLRTIAGAAVRRQPPRWPSMPSLPPT